MKAALGILGGTFDPIHLGHLQIASSLAKACSLSEVKFIPCKFPVHKATTGAPCDMRIQMVKLAIRDKNFFSLDLREVQRESPSYMIETLKSLRNEFKDYSLVFILGMDSFLSLNLWKEWQDYLKYVHIAVATRPGFKFVWPPELERQYKSHVTNNPEVLSSTVAGYLYFHPTQSLEISSSDIRKILNEHSDGKLKKYLPESVLAFIQKNKLYLSNG